jgi:hypothetical protein
LACTQITKIIIENDTVDVLNLDLNEYSNVFFSLTVTDEVNSKVSSSVVYLAGTGITPSVTPDFVEYAIIGDTLNYELSATYNSVDNKLVLTVENTELADLRVDIAEIGKG